MVRTGARTEVLRDLLIAAGLEPATVAPPRPTGKGLGDELLELYRRLGGRQSSPMLRPGGWDLAFKGPLVVELDEELHFNRYRAVTLETSWSFGLPWREDYMRYCTEREAECLAAGRWGKRWTNESCERMFTGGPPGDLGGAGAPRWKQRALYDAVKDSAVSTRSPVMLARLSIYDRVADGMLGDALSQRTRTSVDDVAALLKRRTVTAA